VSDRRIDFTALGTTADPQRWQRIIDEALARVQPALAARRQQRDAVALIASWSRPLLAAAAVAALLLGSLAVTQEDEPETTPAADLAAVSRAAVQLGTRPDAAVLLRIVGTASEQ
jgi:hypothetical protein